MSRGATRLAIVWIFPYAAALRGLNVAYPIISSLDAAAGARSGNPSRVAVADAAKSPPRGALLVLRPCPRKAPLALGNFQSCPPATLAGDAISGSHCRRSRLEGYDRRQGKGLG